MKDIRQIATSFDGQIVALAEFEKQVQIFNISTLQVISEFETILDYGGNRFLISEDGKICICGCWERYGICAYETQTGKKLWQRKDLKKVQNMQLLRMDSNKIFLYFEIGKSRILNITSGEDIEAPLLGAKKYYESIYNPVIIIDKLDKINIIDSLTGKKKFNIKKHSFATLSLDISDNCFAVSESGGPLSCYSIDSGHLKWQVQLNAGEHFLRVIFNKKLNNYIGVSWPYQKGGDKKVKYIARDTGDIKKEFSINCPSETEFALSGKVLITSDKEIYNLETDEKKIWI